MRSGGLEDEGEERWNSAVPGLEAGTEGGVDTRRMSRRRRAWPSGVVVHNACCICVSVGQRCRRGDGVPGVTSPGTWLPLAARSWSSSPHERSCE